MQALLHELLEARRFHRDFVVASRHARKRIDAVLIGFGGPHRSASQILRGDRGADDRGVGWIGYAPGNSSTNFLCVQENRGKRRSGAKQHQRLEHVSPLITYSMR